MATIKIQKQIPKWDLYLVKPTGTSLIVKSASLNTFLNKYFINLSKNLESHPELSVEEILDKYQKLWESAGTIRSYYTDSWGHKWACFPHITKITDYINKIKNG